MRTRLFRTALDTLHLFRLDRLGASLAQGAGVIFTLHCVRPAAPAGFHPNGLLEVTPEFLKTAIRATRASGCTIVTMDEAVARLQSGRSDERFAVFTLDDGYRDNLVHALPVFEEEDCPFLIYVPSDFPTGAGELWWLALERIIAGHRSVRFDLGAGEESFACANDAEKEQAFNTIYAHLRAIDEDAQRAAIHRMAEQHGFDLAALCAEEIMDVAELKTIAAHPLCTIGAHTVTHRAIAKLSPEAALVEMRTGADWLAETLGDRPKHFSFPYGDPGSAAARDFPLAREAGFVSAVTTRKGMLFPEHRDHLHALPRVSLNGHYQDQRYLDLFLSGVPFLIAAKGRKLQVA